MVEFGINSLRNKYNNEKKTQNDNVIDNFKSNNYVQEEDLELNEVRNRKKLANILFIKMDDNGKFYNFTKMNGKEYKFYFEGNEDNIPKLTRIEDFAEWANELRDFLEEWNMDDITTLNSKEKLPDNGNAIIKKILKNTVDKRFQNFGLYSNNVIKMYNTLKDHFLDIYPRKVKDNMWKKIKNDQYCTDRY